MKKLMSGKSFSLLGMICGAIMVILGILVLCGVMGGDMTHANSAPYSYDSGYATFGADFYTYAVNNAEEAAVAGRAAASNAYEIGYLMKNVYGISFIAAGLFMVCLFGTKFTEFQKDEKWNAVIISDTPPVEELPEI